MNTRHDSYPGRSQKRPLAVWLLLSILFLSAGGTRAETAVQAWVQRYSHVTDSEDQARKVVTDNAGNVIVAGFTNERITGRDMLIIKYSGAGVPLWTNRYNGPGNNYDNANAVAVDGSGNVFVTGSSTGSGSADDYATIAYSGAGVPLWTNRYNGPGNSTDQANAMAVDGSGSVFVTGYSLGSGSSYDYATIAYSGAGVPLWTNRYNGPGNSEDRAYAVAVDGSGNVFVTGYSTGNGSSYDYATIAYSGAGVSLWTNLYSTPGRDEAYAIAVDGSGNVFVTGSSTGSGSADDYATIAYSGAGVPLWTNRYNGPGNSEDRAYAVAVDGSGNVFVTGYSTGNGSDFDYATIAYSGAGVPLWTNRYNGPGNSYDYAQAVAVDGSGNVFVTGLSTGSGSSYDYATIAYSGAGVPLWTNRYNGPGNDSDPAYAVAVDGSGNVFVTGSSTGSGSSYDYATIAYSGAGVPLWTNRYNGPGNFNDHAHAVAVDGSDNVFVTGPSTGNGSDFDYATIAYSGAGVPLWTNRYNGPGNSFDYANAVAVDGSGNVFVTGDSIGSGSYFDYATIAYSGACVPLWTNRYNGPGNDSDEAHDMAVDGSGNVFVTGYSYASGGVNSDYATIAYSGAGVPLWTNRYNGPGNSYDNASAVAVDGSGNVFVTGSSTGSGSAGDYATIAYSGAGVPLWTNRYNGPGNNTDQANDMAVDGSGNVFVTGYSTGNGFNDDYATIKYSGAGVSLWTNRYNGTGNGLDQAYAVAVDDSGNVFVTGVSTGSGNSYNYATIAYSGAGVPLWTNRYDGPGISDDFAQAVAADSSGNVFVTGYSTGSGSSYDYATIAYSGAGVPLWTNRYNGPANGGDSPKTKKSLALGPGGSVYVTGASDGDYGGTTYDFATIKYISVPVLTLERDGNGGFFIQVNGVPNVTYRLQRAPTVTGAWSDLATNTAPASGLIEYHDTSPLPGQAFYRATAP